MITEADRYLKNRLSKIFENLDLEAILIVNGANPTPNFLYTTQFANGFFEGCPLIVKRDGYTLLCAKTEYDIAKEQTNQEVIYPGIEWEAFPKILKEQLKDFKRIGAVENETTIKSYKETEELINRTFIYKVLPWLKVLDVISGKYKEKKFVDVTKNFEKARYIKEPYEIKKIKKAANLVSGICDEIPYFNFNKINTEAKLAAEIEYEMKKSGSKKSCFDTIVSSGKNSALIHYTNPSQRKLKEGDIILTDFGATVENYISDITRTFFFGKPNDKQIKLYNLVKEMQENMFKELKPEIGFKELNEIFNKGVLEATGKEREHDVGHSIGIEVHDEMSMHYEKFLPGSVLTIEPGIYIQDFGGVRIEDDVCITRNGYKLLTSAKKNIEDIII